MWKEAIGLFATIMILISMSFKTLSYKGSLWMRITNIIGSVLFTIYGFILPAYSTGILNGVLIFVNIFHLTKLVSDEKKAKKSEQTENNK